MNFVYHYTTNLCGEPKNESGLPYPGWALYTLQIQITSTALWAQTHGHVWGYRLTLSVSPSEVSQTPNSTGTTLACQAETDKY